mgnify:CR=1 FL=1
MNRSRAVGVAVVLASTLAFAVEQRTVDEAVGLKVLSFQEQVTDLKEKVALSKARLRELQRLALGGDPAAAQLVIVHHNRVGPGYALASAAYALDGVPVWARAGEGLAAQPRIEVFRGRLAPGPHLLSLQMLYRGTGMTLFPYHEGYTFKLRSSWTVQLEPAQGLTLEVAGVNPFDLTASPEHRLGIHFELTPDAQR